MILAPVAALIGKLSERGLSPAEIIDVIQSMADAEVAPRKAMTNSERQARYRAKRVSKEPYARNEEASQNVTNAVTEASDSNEIPLQNVTQSVTFEPEISGSGEPTPYGVSNIYIPLPTVEDASASLPVTDRSLLWSEGIPTIIALGVSEKSARGLVGKWMRDTGNDAGRVIAAIRLAGEAAPINPVPWITACLKQPRAPPWGKSQQARNSFNSAVQDLADEYRGT